MTGSDEAPKVIAGFGRSGTTWVQDVLAEANGLRPVFEPLHPQYIAGADEFAHRCLSATDSLPGLKEFLDPFFFGSYRSLWADYRIIRKDLVPNVPSLITWQGMKEYRRKLCTAKENFLRYEPMRKRSPRIVKFIRANMMLSWLKENFDARIVFVVRHPAAVVLSQLGARQVWNPVPRIERYKRDEKLMAELAQPLTRLLFNNPGDVEAYTLCWCIENSIALRQAITSGIQVVHYESLLTDPEKEWTAILAALDLQIMPDDRLVRRPSQQAWGEKATDARLLRQYSAWEQQVDQRMASRMQRVLDAAGLRLYTMDSAEPDFGA